MWYFTYVVLVQVFMWLMQYSENMKVLSWDKHLMLVLLFPVHWIQIGCFTKKSRTNWFTEFRDLRGFRVSVPLIHSFLSNTPVTQQRVASAPSPRCGQWWWVVGHPSCAPAVSQQSVQSLQAPSKVTKSDTEKMLLCRHPRYGHVLRFLGEDWCVEMF